MTLPPLPVFRPTPEPKRLFAYDFESFLIQPGCQAPPLVCMSFANDRDTPELLHVRDSRFAKTLVDALRDPECAMLAHYHPFEQVVLLAHDPDLVGLIFAKERAGLLLCTWVREKLLRIAKGDWRDGFALDDCHAAHATGIQLDKKDPWRLKYGTLIDVACEDWPAEARAYALGDVSVRDVYWAQQDAARRAFPNLDIFKNQHHQLAAAVSLQLSSCWGFMADPEASGKMVEKTAESLDRDRDTLLSEGLVRIERKKGVSVYVKTKEKAEDRMVRASEAAGRTVPRGEPTEKMLAEGKTVGNIKLDEEACLASGDPLLGAYTRYGQANTLMGKVRRIDRAARLEKPVQASYDVLGAKSSRTSCRQGDDPAPGEAYSSYGSQLQNPPTAPGVRECYVPRDECAIVSIDFDAFELCTWSQICLELLGYSDMAEVLKDPKRCCHVEMGARLEGLTLADAYTLKQSDPKRFKLLRQLAKAYNFSAPGGGGAETLSIIASSAPYNIPTTPSQARDHLDAWRAQWREAGAYLDYVAAEVGGRGRRMTLVHDRSGFVRGDVGFCDAANSRFQERAAQAAKAGTIALKYAMYEERASGIYGARLLTFVHDEVLLEVPLKTLHETAHQARDIFVRAAQPWTPLVPLKASPAAMLRWRKAAGEPQFDVSGQLICWEESEAYRKMLAAEAK